jgi:hypothetical protein
MYLCVRGIGFASVSTSFSVGFWKSSDNIVFFLYFEYISPTEGFELTMLVVIGSDCTGRKVVANPTTIRV